MPRRIGYSISEENFPGSDIAADEWEFLRAMAAYQKRHARRFPSWREALAVLKALGYRKVAEPEAPSHPSPQPPPRSGEGEPEPTARGR